MTRWPAYIEFFLFVAISIVAGWHSLASTFALAGSNDEYTHIFLILPVAAALVLMGWRDTRLMSRSPRAGSVLLFAALLAAVCATSWPAGLPVDVRLSTGMLALVLWWIGAFVFSFGVRASGAFLFPLCFLLWLVPFPKVLLDAVIGLLQRGSALSARLLFSAAGVPVAQDALRVSIPDLTVEVAKECSSIRSSTILLVTTMVLAQLLLRSPWRKALVIALAVPLSVAKNGLRIFTIAMLGTRVDPGYLVGKLHHDGGIVFFAIALGIIFFLIWILKRIESRMTRAAGQHPVASELLTIS